ncbi:MAG: STAS domain-containing protein [Isosphaeraceae bacterium]
MLKPSVQVHEHEGILIAEFWDCWRLDPAPVQDLRSRYEAHRRKNGRPELVIDLGGVGFAGSASLGGFVALHREARQNGGRLIFCNVEPTVSEVFRASKLAPLFELVPDRAAALDSVARGPPTAPAVGNQTAPEAGPEQARPEPGGPAGSARLRRGKTNPDPS